jgi:hypothetical protein
MDMRGPAFTLGERYPKLNNIEYLDIEATGLEEGSYPIQFGWCGLDLEPKTVFVKPHSSWPRDMFTEEAFNIHKIEYEYLLTNGSDVEIVSTVLNGHLKGKSVGVDSPGWDGYWTLRLFEASRVKPQFLLDHVEHIGKKIAPIANRWCISNYHSLNEAVDEMFPHTHKAHEDALRLAAKTRMFIDKEWCEWLLDTYKAAPDNIEDAKTSVDKTTKVPE